MKYFILVVIFFISSAIGMTQEALFSSKEIVSPLIHSDNSVTFTFYAPKADSVLLTGDFLPSIKVNSPFGIVDAPGKALMIKNDNGLWTYTTTPLDQELYNYSLIVDGMTTTDPSNPYLARDIANITNIFIIGGQRGNLYKVNDVAHGTVTKRWYNAIGIGMNRRLTIYTPPGYETNKKIKYPVLYLLHGAGGDEDAWMELGRATQILDNLMAQKKIQPMIVVMPNGNVTQDAAPGQGKEGLYKPQFMIPRMMNGEYESSFMDIVKFVEQNYTVKKDKNSRAIAGLSMGGFHSMHISRYYPNTFGYIGLFSAAIMPREDETGKVYNEVDFSLQRQMVNGYKLYWIAIGKTDFLYKANTEFRQKLDSLGVKYQYVESEGGHIWRNWRIYLSDFLPLLFN